MGGCLSRVLILACVALAFACSQEPETGTRGTKADSDVTVLGWIEVRALYRNISPCEESMTDPSFLLGFCNASQSQ